MWPGQSVEALSTSAWTVARCVGTFAPQHRRDLPDLLHERVELIGKQRLHAIRQRAIGIVMDFDDQTVGSNGDSGAGERRHFVALARAVAGIDDDGQMAEALHGGNDG